MDLPVAVVLVALWLLGVLLLGLLAGVLFVVAYSVHELLLAAMALA